MISKIANILKESDNIAIVSHIMPDGDSVGSTLALYSALKRLGKNVYVLSSDNIPSVYSFLPYVDEVLYCNSISNLNCNLLAVLDCGSIERTGDLSFVKFQKCINIDHHVTNSQFADFSLVDSSASSTGELIYNVIRLLNDEISKEEAMCLYTAILTDTGCFKYSNTTYETHRIAGELIKCGIDFGSIHDMVYRNFEYEGIKLLGKALSSVEMFERGKIAYIELLYDDIKKFNIKNISTSDFIDYARDINGVELAAFVKEISPNEFRVSLRSKHTSDVREVCEKFGGGGHTKAAGCTMKGDILEVKNTLINELINALKDDEA